MHARQSRCLCNHPIIQSSNYPTYMTHVPISMPQLGESIAEATIINLLVEVGDSVEADQDLFEVETNKATMNVASPCPGRVEKLLVELNESYPVGAVLGYLEASKADAARLGLDQPRGTNVTDGNGQRSETKRSRAVEPTVRGLPVPA